MKRLLKGGRVVDPAHGIDGARDVLIDGDRIAAVGRGPAGRRRRRGDRGARRASSSARASSTCTCTCASRARSTRRRSRPARRRRPPAASPPSPACRTPIPVNDNAERDARSSWRRRPRPGRRARLPDRRGVEGARRASSSPRSPTCARPAASRSPTTAGRCATALLMRRALEYAGMFGMPVIDHCEDPTLKGDGVAHEGYVASLLGLRGIPAAAERRHGRARHRAGRADRRRRCTSRT